MPGLVFKKALVVYNKPLYELHILEDEDSHFRKLLKKRHPTTQTWKAVHEQHQESLNAVQRTLSLLGIDTDLLYRKELKSVASRYDLIVTVGGDGTFLETSHYLKSQLLLGVNAAPVDSTGALCRARTENFLTLITDLLTGDLKPKLIPRLKVKINGKPLPYPALNDVLFANKSPAGTSRYLLQIGKKTEEHKSSGIWLASGTGSTAAIRSSGGKPLPITHPGLQYAVRELFPEAGKKFSLTHGILSAAQKIVIHPKMRQASLFIDGNHIEIPVLYGDKIEISSSGPKLRAIL